MTISTTLPLPPSPGLLPQADCITASVDAQPPQAHALVARATTPFGLSVALLAAPDVLHGAGEASSAPSPPPKDMCGLGEASALPSPLRMVPFWRGARAQCKCIIYLEPRIGSPLSRAIEGFLRASAELVGRNEAHQYHPHSSMTGFIDLTDREPVGTGVVARIAAQLHRVVAADGRLPAPRVRSVAIASDYPHPGTHKLELQLDTPAVFRAIIDEVVRAAPEAGIRPKRMGHISLAYCNKHIDTGTVLSAESARALSALARSFTDDPAIGDPAQNLWDIAFYELSFKSPVVSMPHRFTQIARWQL